MERWNRICLEKNNRTDHNKGRHGNNSEKSLSSSRLKKAGGSSHYYIYIYI